jgi:hypothetical protein
MRGFVTYLFECEHGCAWRLFVIGVGAVFGNALMRLLA